MRYLLMVAAAGLLGVSVLAATARPAPAPATGPSDSRGKSGIGETFKTLVQPISPDPNDSELQSKLKERHNSAARLLSLRLEEFQKGTRDSSSVFEAARIVVESKLDLAQTPQERQRVLEQVVSVAKSVEGLVGKQVDSGFAPQAELERARLARLSAEVQLLKAQQEATSQPADRK